MKLQLPKINFSLPLQQRYSQRRWTPLLISLGLVCLTGSLGTIASILLWQNSLNAEKQQTQQNVDRALDAIAKEIETIDGNNFNFSNWDDTYNFVDTPNLKYLQDSFHPDVVTKLGINLFLISNTSQQIIIAKSFDTVNYEEINFPSQLLNYFSAQPQLLIPPQINSSYLETCRQ